MGRFFQISNPNFVDDFIYQPNWDLVKETMAKQEGRIKEAADTIQLLNDIDIDYWKDADEQNVQNIRDFYTKEIDNISNDLRGDILNNGALKKVRQLRNKLYKDYKTGDISKIIENKKAYNKFLEENEKLTDIATRQKYKEDYVDRYLRDNPNGALSKIFKHNALMDKRDLLAEFLNSENFKALKASGVSETIENVNGMYMVKTSQGYKGLDESIIGKAFQAYIDANRGSIEAYGRERERLFGDSEKFFENGQLSYNNGFMLGNALEATKNYAYKDVEKSRTMSPNQVAMQQAGFAHDKEMFRMRQAAEERAAARAAAYARGSSDIADSEGNFLPVAENLKLINLYKLNRDYREDFFNYGRNTGKSNIFKNSFNDSQKLKIFEDFLNPNSTWSKRFPYLHDKAILLKKQASQEAYTNNQDFARFLGGYKKFQELNKNVAIGLENNNLKFSLPLSSGEASPQKYTFKDMYKSDVWKIKEGSIKINKENLGYISSSRPGTDIGQTIVAVPIDYVKIDKKTRKEENRTEVIYTTLDSIGINNKSFNN